MTSFVSGGTMSIHGLSGSQSAKDVYEVINSLIRTPRIKVSYKEICSVVRDIIKKLDCIDVEQEATEDLLNVRDTAMYLFGVINQNVSLRNLAQEMEDPFDRIDYEIKQRLYPDSSVYQSYGKRGSTVRQYGDELPNCTADIQAQPSIQIKFQDADDIVEAIKVWKAFFDRVNSEKLRVESVKVESGILIDWLRRNQGLPAAAASAIENWCTFVRQKINEKMTSRGMFAKKDKRLWGGTDLVVQNVSNALQAALGL